MKVGKLILRQLSLSALETLLHGPGAVDHLTMLCNQTVDPAVLLHLVGFHLAGKLLVELVSIALLQIQVLGGTFALSVITVLRV